MSSAAERARSLDDSDPLAFTRIEFRVPTRAEIGSTRLVNSGSQ